MADGSNLNLALVMRADVAQAKAELQSVQAEIAKTGATAKTASTGTAELGVSTAAVAESAQASTQALNAFGETAEQSAARIHQMVTAGLAQAEAQKAAAAATRQVGAAIGSSTEAASANAAAVAASQKAWFAQTGALVRAQAAAEQAESILAKTSLTTAQVAKAEELYNVAVAGGVRTTAQQVAAFSVLDAAKVKDVAVTEGQTVATEALGKAQISARTQYSAFALVSDAATGQFSRSRREMAALANESGILGRLLTPAGLAIGGVAAALGLLALAFVDGEKEGSAFNNALILTGGYAGKSAAQLQAMAIQLDDLQGVTEHAAAGVIAQVAGTGKFFGDQIKMVSTAALQMQQATGQSIDATIKQFEQLGTDPVDGILKLDDTMHFLTQSVFDQINALEQQGQSEQAAALAQQTYADALAKRTSSVLQNVGLLQSAWEGLKNIAKETWDAVLDVGRSDTGANLQMWQRQLDVARQNMAMPGLDDATIRAFMQQANEAQQQIDNLSGKTAADVKQTSDALKAQAELTKGGLTTLQQYMASVTHYTDLYKKAIAGASDTAKAAALSALNVHLAAAQKTYDAANRAPRAARPRATPIDHSAEQLAKQAAQAQAQLTAALIQQKAAVDPAAAAWMTYSVAVGKANADADAALKLHPQEAAAINATRDAQIALAGVARDSKLDQLADKDREAWERLKKSVESPLQAHLDAFIAQLEQINALIAKNPSRAGDFRNLLDDAIDKSMPRQPGAASQFVRRSPGQELGAASGAENDWFAASQKQLETERKAALAAAIASNQNLLDVNRSFDAKEEALARTHQQTMGAIQMAQASFALDTAQQGFGALAQAMANAYGEQSKQARIAFGLQKVAAIASAALAINTSIANSSKIGFPWNIVAIAGAIAQGIALMANVNSVSMSGGGGSYDIGGYTGAGGKHEVAGLVHRGEGVFSQEDIAALGGPGAFLTLQRGLRGYADGGLVGAGPTLDEIAGRPQIPAFARPSMAAFAGGASSGARGAPPQVKVVVVMDKDQMAHEIMNTPTGQKVIVQTAGDNPRAIRGKWGA